MDHTDDLIPTRESLLTRLKDWGDHESWKEFFETYWRLIYRTARKAGLNDAEAQDVVQDTMVSVFKAMPQFEYRQDKASFKAWLLRLTRWRIVDHLRKRDPAFALQNPARQPGTETDPLERLPDPAIRAVEATWEADWQDNLMEVAIERVKAKANPKFYQIFDQCVFKERPVSEVAAAMGISAARVYLAKHRVANAIKKEVKSLQMQPVPVVNQPKSPPA